MQDPRRTASSFVDNPVISPPQRSSYLAVVMGTVQLRPNWSGDGGQKRKWIEGGRNRYFRSNAFWLITCTARQQPSERPESRSPAWLGVTSPESVLGKDVAFQREISHPLPFFVILEKYHNCAPEQELQRCSEILCGLSAFVTQGNTCLKYVILQFKLFD